MRYFGLPVINNDLVSKKRLHDVQELQKKTLFFLQKCVCQCQKRTMHAAFKIIRFKTTRHKWQKKAYIYYQYFPFFVRRLSEK